MTSPDLPAPWGVFHRLQTVASCRRISPLARGRDEALTELPDTFGAAGCDPPDPDDIRRRFDVLCGNRAAKYRRRAQIDRRIAGGTRATLADRHTHAVAVKELADLVRRAISDADWVIFRMLSEGFTYREVADRRGMTVEALKSRISRVRSRLRDSPVGRQVQDALAAC